MRNPHNPHHPQNQQTLQKQPDGMVEFRALVDQLIHSAQLITEFSATGIAAVEKAAAQSAEIESLKKEIAELRADREEHCNILHKGTVRERSLISRVETLELTQQQILSTLQQIQQQADKGLDRKFVVAGLLLSALGVIVAVIALLK